MVSIRHHSGLEEAMDTAQKFYIHTMGCKSNQFETSVIIENLQKNGLRQTFSIEEADIYILNTCTVTRRSDNEANYILRNARHKNPRALIIVTGCVAQIEKEKLLEQECVDIVVGNDEKLHLFDVICSKFEGQEAGNTGGLQDIIPCKVCYVSDIMKLNKFNKVSIEDMSKTRASLKIQDGCDNRCSYCIIPFARGKSRSADIDFIIKEINNLSKHGFKEVVFTGIHIGLWGRDFGMTLIDLLCEVEAKTSIARFRLGSLNPLEITDELLDFLQKSEKFCPHFHLSLQSACNKTLKSMNRFYKVEDYLKQIDKINSMFNLPFLGSDIIAGFAGETDDDFEVTRQNLERSGLSQIHTFPYSKRAGTVGAEAEGQVDERVKEQRAGVIKSISSRKFAEFVNKNTGTVQEILIEKHPDKNGFLKGVTRNYLTVVTDSDDLDLTNTLQKVKVTRYENGKIFGELI